MCVVGEKEEATKKTKQDATAEWGVEGRKTGSKEAGDVRKLTALVRVQWPVYVELFSGLI